MPTGIGAMRERIASELLYAPEARLFGPIWPGRVVASFNHLPMSDPAYNPLAPEYLADPYPFFAHAHRETPVFFSERFNLWVVTRYEDIWTALRDPGTFSSAISTTVGTQVSPEVEAVLAEGWGEIPTLVTSDPPAHTRFRSLINKAFTPRRVIEREARIREIATQLVDGFEAEGTTDLIRRYTYPLPMTVIAEILGVPHRDLDRFKRWSDDIVARLSAELPAGRQVACARSLVEFQHYFSERLDERSGAPRDDMLTDLLNARVEGAAPLTRGEQLSILQQLLVAGNETTTNLIANLVVLLLERPAAWQAIREQPARATAAIEEALRMESPVQGLFRSTTRATQLGGVTLPAGAHLQLLYGAGNRDAAEFPEPERFDLERANASSHLAFGGGVHFCLGASLARLESRIALEVLTARLPTLALAPGRTLERVPHFFLRGFEHLWVTWEPAA
jgi:cytochrome P450